MAQKWSTLDIFGGARDPQLVVRRLRCEMLSKGAQRARAKVPCGKWGARHPRTWFFRASFAYTLLLLLYEYAI